MTDTVINGFKIESLKESNGLIVSIPDSDKTFTILDLGSKIEIVSVNSDRHKSCLSIIKNDE